MQFAALHESLVGTFRTFRHVRWTVAMRGKADVLCSARAFPLLTHIDHSPAFHVAVANPVLAPNSLLLGYADRA